MADKSKKDQDKLIARNKKRFTPKELDSYKKLLLEIRDKIAGNLRHLEESGLNVSQRDAAGDLSGYSLHMADQATDNFDREFNLGLASNEQELLNQIDVVLRKFKEGTYGMCETTGKPISKKRLQAMPYARLCIEAQEEEEREQRRQ